MSEENMELRRIFGLTKSEKQDGGERYMIRTFII
jgi:hypothetical protein